MNIASFFAAIIFAATGGIFTFLKWLRVAQREHYLPGSTSRFATRWWLAHPVSKFIAVVAVAGTVLSIRFPLGACLAGLALIFGPIGLSVRGRSAPLAWTRRLKSVAAVAASLVVTFAVLGSAITDSVMPLALSTLAIPVLLDFSLLLLRPFEKRIARRYILPAVQRLKEIHPIVIAITGSYGKTTTKEYVRHLVSGARAVVASPASYNNTAGLCRTVNEHLTPGTDVLIAEVGTYGKGEIREICSWLKPSIGVITSIGPVHLERMGSLENIAQAKAEILENVEVAILNIDFPQLRNIANGISSKSVVCCGSSAEICAVAAKVSGQSIELCISGKHVATLRNPGLFAGNLALAVAAAVSLDVPVDHIVKQLDSLPSPAHRQQVVKTSTGVQVIDDTYNSNPAGAAHALRLLSTISHNGRRVVISPGMIELGNRQSQENERFARNAASAATDILIVGRTNLGSLLKGTRDGKARVLTVRCREDAVRWVRENLAAGDVVLYENDLPDHFP